MTATRMILALAAHADDTFIWDRVKAIQADMFAAGPVQIKFAYFGREGTLASRPCITTRWASSADDLADLMDRGRSGCVCGRYVNVSDLLAEALKETEQGPVQAVIIIGDFFHGDLDEAISRAKLLRAAGTRLFVFQQTCDRSIEQAFKALVEMTGGAFLQFNPHVERVADRLPGLFEGVACFAVGGMQALQTQDNEAAALLLEQLNAGDRIASVYPQAVNRRGRSRNER